jgi:hypothetical protein
VMDDWQGHYECLKLPYSRWRKRLLTEVIDPATVRFAVSRETAAHYEEIFGNSWLVVHKGVAGAELIHDETLRGTPMTFCRCGVLSDETDRGIHSDGAIKS